jgi:hypothetical protein
MMISLTAAHAMELGVESVGAAVTEPAPAPRSSTVVVLRFADANGSPQQLDCVMASPRVLSPSLLVNREDVDEVVRELCASVDVAPVVSDDR